MSLLSLILREDKKILFHKVSSTQYHNCRCLDDARSQSINNYVVDLILPEYFDLSTRRANSS